MLRVFSYSSACFLLVSLAHAGPSLPERLELAQFSQAEKLMQDVVRRYERSRSIYMEKGPQPFVNSLSDKISYEHKKEIMQMLSKLPELPSLSMANKSISFSLSDETPLSFNIYDVVLGKFSSGTFNKRYNYNASPKENLESFKLKDRETSATHKWQPFNFLILPTAHAKSQKHKNYYPGIIALGSLNGATILPALFRIYPDDYGAGGGHE